MQAEDIRNQDQLKIGMVQISPVWLNREKTAEKIINYIDKAAAENCSIAAFGEALLPGYPFWIEHTNGAKFNSAVQKEIYSYYMQQAVDIEAGHLEKICKTAGEKKIAVVLGCIECPGDRGSHSLYCSLVYIDKSGEIKSIHRKLMPTYEERLVWAAGDGHGLQVHKLGAFTIGALNCWENWMPLARTAMYAQGEDLHFAVWPGSDRNTKDITRFIAMESRSFVVSVSGIMRRQDISADMPHSDLLISNCPEIMANGGSCASGPAGNWLMEPVIDREGLFTIKIDHSRVREERQNFDPSGHYSRPDVTKLIVNKERQSILGFKE